MQLVGSQGFLERIVELHKQDPDEPYDVKSKYTAFNSARIELNEISVNESTLKAVAAICAKYHVDYQNNVELQLEARQELIRAVTTYGLFGAILTVLFFFVISSVQNDENAALAEKTDILHKAGLERSEAVRQRLADAAAQLLPLLLAVPVFAIIMQLADGWGRELLGKLRRDPMQERFASQMTPRWVLSVLQPKVTLPCLALLLLICWLITSGALNRRKDREIKQTTAERRE